MDAEQERELRALIDEGELALLTRDAATALARATSVHSQLGNRAPVGLLRDTLRLRASAQEVDGDIAGAITTLRELTDEPFADVLWITSLIALSRCYREMGDLDQAISVGEDAESIIAAYGLAGTTEAIQLSITVAGGYIIRGDFSYARRICRRAIQVAEAHDSAIGLASAYWNASIVETETGDAAAALDLARLALAEFERSDDGRNVARLRLQVAELHLRTDPPEPDVALALMDQAELEAAWSPTSGADKARHYLNRASAYLAAGEPVRARQSLGAASDLAPEAASNLRAWIHVLVGRVDAAEGNLECARAQFQDAALSLTGAGRDRWVAQLWFELGAQFQIVGDIDSAKDAFRRAAVTRGLQSRIVRPAR